MLPVPVTVVRPPQSVPTPLRRALPVRVAAWSPLRTAVLALAGLVVFVDIEFSLAYLLYFAMHATR